MDDGELYENSILFRRRGCYAPAVTRSILTLALSLASILVLVTVSACVSMREKHERQIQSTRAAAEAAPGAPREALAFADAIIWNLSEEDAERRVRVSDHALEFAAKNLDEAAAKVPEEAPLLFLREARLFELARDDAKAEAAYVRSVEARPTSEALAALMRLYGKRGDIERVRGVCVEGAPALADHELRSHVETCADAAHATSTKTAVDWLREEDRTRLQNHTASELRAEIEETTKAAARERAAEICIAECKQVGYTCVSRCRNDTTCPGACEGKYQGCLDECAARLR